MRDYLPTHPKKIECAVVNLDSIQNEGTHWVAYIKINNRSWYFDSFGDLKPPLEIVNYLRKTDLQYNYNSYQNFNSVNCGHLCLKFLDAFSKKYLK